MKLNLWVVGGIFYFLFLLQSRARKSESSLCSKLMVCLVEFSLYLSCTHTRHLHRRHRNPRKEEEDAQ